MLTRFKPTTDGVCGSRTFSSTLVVKWLIGGGGGRPRFPLVLVMLILGLNTFHADASAVLVDVDSGRLLAAVAEERINRVKHFAGFPGKAVEECLSIAGAKFADVGHVAVARDGKANLLAKMGFAVRNLPRITQLARQRLERRAEVASAPQLLERQFGLPSGGLKAKVHAVEHHLAHLSSSFFVSPFEDAALLSIDGFGDFASTMSGVGRDAEIEIFDRTLFPHSMGVVYTAVCQFIGYDRYGDEGKVMGLAPYGKDEHRAFFDELVKLESNGRFRLNLDYFIHHTEGVDYSFDESGKPTVASLYSKKLVDRFGPPRKHGEELTQRDMDFARSLQACLERVYFHMLNHLYDRTKLPRLCLAGGVALNSVANGMVLDHTPFKEVYIQPAAGDDGTAVGAAYWVLNHVLKKPRSFVMESAETGTRYTNKQCAAALRAAGVQFETLPESDLLKRTAEIIAQGKVVGWFQGGMEWGPRALGHRSILAHPGFPGMKDILNARIKHREWFRPFAPVVLEERLNEIFESNHPTPFMLMVYKTRPEWRERLSAVNHVDDTGRVQTVKRSTAPRYYGVVEAFGRITGIPVLINTSFNENEPIVRTPEEAVACYLRTKMDALVIEDHLCVKAD
jgi:carbamoyltransferase